MVNGKYLRRKAYSKLFEWKKATNGTLAIRLDGAKRVGKTTLVKEFAKNEYKSYLYIDFSTAGKQIRDILISNALDFDLLFNKLSQAYGVHLYRRKSLVVFDEVQMFPFARQMIKHFVEDGRYDFIEIGSLITVQSNKQNILNPSEEQLMLLYPLDFEEFLWAMGVEDLAEYLNDCYSNNVPAGGAVHSRAMDWFRQYMLVGGMPQAVLEYTKARISVVRTLLKKKFCLSGTMLSPNSRKDLKRRLNLFSTVSLLSSVRRTRSSRSQISVMGHVCGNMNQHSFGSKTGGFPCLVSMPTIPRQQVYPCVWHIRL